jgi:lipopolysaccharide export system permease protein
MLAGDLEALTNDNWANRHQQMRESQARLHRLHTEPWRRVANGFSCLCFALVGAPLAIRLRNADGWSSFGLCFLPILLVYYPLMIYGVSMAKSGDMPPACVWLGNLVLFAIGYWQIRKVLRY